jgi:mannose-6-phosphate isomerase-like protein (cupin superfamily)
MPIDGRHVTLEEMLARLPTADGRRWEVAFRRGSIEVELYAPRVRDPQGPHTRDELYVVVGGRGEFYDGETRRPFGPGDVMLVPAGVEHRFEQFTDDLAVWVIFYGPEGGETPG